jgi:addiction module RelE/StbE family toxin
MAKVVWSDAALYELAEIRAYIAIFDPAAAGRMVAKLQKVGNSLTEFPLHGRPSIDGSRELATVSPYVLCYDVVGDVVTVLHIRHGRRHRQTS